MQLACSASKRARKPSLKKPQPSQRAVTPTGPQTPKQEAQKAAVEAEAALIAFDRQNHMGMRDETAAGIQSALKAEAEAFVEGKGAVAKTVVSLKDNEDRMKTLNVSGRPVMSVMRAVGLGLGLGLGDRLVGGSVGGPLGLC